MAMAMLGSLTAGQAVALGLGDIELKSALNQPLDAEVELLSATDAEMKEMKVLIGSDEAFDKAGIDRPLFLSRLRFSVVHNDQGTPVIHITSKDVVREPFLDFLLEISWSKGRLLREYTVLVDPPVTMPATAPATRAPVARSTNNYTPATPPPAVHARHTGLPPTSAAPGEYGPTRRNDTLWKIAEQVRPDQGVSMEQTMLGLLRANPEAFVNNNINNLKAGYILRVPERAELTSVSRGEALQQARSQYSEWKQANGFAPVEAGPATAAGATDGAPVTAAEDSRLQLVAPDADELTAGTGSADQLNQVQRELMMANEAMEAQRRQSEEMSSRLTLLEEQIQNMQRLIQLKDNELARLQHAAGEGVADDFAAVGETTADGEVTAVAEDATAAEADELLPAETVVEVPDEMAADGETAEPDTAVSGVDSETVVSDEDMVGPLPESIVDEMPLNPEAAVMDELLVEDAGLLAADPLETDITDFEADPFATAEAEDGGIEPPVVESEEVQSETTVVNETQDIVPMSFVDRLMANPSWLAAGGLVLALLAFFGLRRKRGVDTEFQESILQAAQESSTASSDSEISAGASESGGTTPGESSLLSEFAVSDMGSLKNDGEADPLAEADVYLAYGRFQQAEDLVRDALAKNPEHEELNLKMLEVLQAGQNQTAFDEHAQAILARLENSDNPMWDKVAEMGREISPDNPMYQAGAMSGSPADDAQAFEPVDFGGEGVAQNDSADETMPETDDAKASSDEGLAFDIDLSFDDAEENRSEDTPDSEAFTPEAEVKEDVSGDSTEPALNVEMGTVEPDSFEQNADLDIDLENFEFGESESVVADDEPAGDGELADLDEVSTKLDLARAYIDMGDPDGARGILDEVMKEGNDEQKNEAQDILGQIA